MSRSEIMHLLKAGPKTAREMAALTRRTTGDVSRTCCDLRQAGKIERVDGADGRGSRAVYALTEYGGLALLDRPHAVEEQPTTRLDQKAAAKAYAETLRVERDPCTYCGVRADIGCKHRAAF